MAEIEAFFDEPTATVTYLVWDPDSHAAAVIDPVLDFEPNAARISTESVDAVLAAAAARDLRIDWVLETHAHADHLSAANEIRTRTGAKIGIGARIVEVQEVFAPIFQAGDEARAGRAFDHLFEDGERFRIGGLDVEVMHTPGHTPACVAYHIDDAVFVGDTIFMPDFGTARTDFPGGDAATLFRSIRRILSLPPETRVFVGHDYPPPARGVPAWESTVAEERAANIHVHEGVSEADFVALRDARDRELAAPRLILPSLQVNIRGGAPPAPAADGHVYLTLPVNRL